MDEVLFQKTLEIETKRENLIKKKLKAEKLADGVLKRRLKYQADKEYDKYLDSPGDEERCLHEAYQFLMREFEARNKLEQVLELFPLSFCKKQSKLFNPFNHKIEKTQETIHLCLTLNHYKSVFLRYAAESHITALCLDFSVFKEAVL